MTDDEISSFIETQSEEVRAFKSQLFDLVLYAKGVISINDVYNMSREDRYMFMKSFNDYIKNTTPDL